MQPSRTNPATNALQPLLPNQSSLLQVPKHEFYVELLNYTQKFQASMPSSMIYLDSYMLYIHSNGPLCHHVFFHCFKVPIHLKLMLGLVRRFQLFERYAETSSTPVVALWSKNQCAENNIRETSKQHENSWTLLKVPRVFFAHLHVMW